MIAVDPRRRVPLHLASDADTPEESRPTFLARAPSESEAMEIDELCDAHDLPEKTGRERAAIRAQIFAMFLRDWRNVTNESGQPIAFSLGLLTVLLHHEEIMDLLGQCLELARLGTKKKPSSEPSAVIATESSAPIALPESV